MRGVAAAVLAQPLEQGFADVALAIGNLPGAADQLDAVFSNGAAFAVKRPARALSEDAVTVPGAGM